MEKTNHKARRRLFALAFGLLLLAMTEALLRLFNVAPPARPVSETFALEGRVYEQKGEFLRTRPDRKKYFLYQSFQKEKRPGTLRVFITGGSVAMGFPLQEDYGPGRLLSVALDAAEPSREHEVINAGGFGYASYRLLPVVEELLTYDPDVIVLMTGNNEFLEQRFENVTETDISKALHHVRLYRVLYGAAAAFMGKADEVNWNAHQVNDRERSLATQDFEKSITAMARLCKRSGVSLVLVVPPANIKDYHPYGESRVERKTQEKIDRLLKERKYESALSLIKENKSGAPDAWIFYEEAWARHGLGGKGADPLKLWRRARDLDPVPVRVLSRMENVIRRTSDKQGSMLADAAEVFAGAASVSAAPGDSLFFDHCHPHPEGQRILSMEIVRTLVRNKLIGPSGGWEDRAMDSLARAYEGLSDEDIARSYYQAAYEAGINMGRTCRGMELVEVSLKLDGNNRKALRLRKRLGAAMKEHYCLTGD